MLCTKVPLASSRISSFPCYHGGSVVCGAHFKAGKMALDTNQIPFRILKLTISYMPSGSRETGQVNEYIEVV